MSEFKLITKNVQSTARENDFTCHAKLIIQHDQESRVNSKNLFLGTPSQWRATNHFLPESSVGTHTIMHCTPYPGKILKWLFCVSHWHTVLLGVSGCPVSSNEGFGYPD